MRKNNAAIKSLLWVVCTTIGTLMTACGGGGGGSSSGGSAPAPVQVAVASAPVNALPAHVQIHAPNHSYTWLKTESHWTDSQNEEQVMTAWHINSSEGYGVDHEDRGLTTSVFYFNDNLVEAAIFERHPYKIPPHSSVNWGKQLWGPIRRSDFSTSRLTLDYETQTATWEEVTPARLNLTSIEKELNAQEFNAPVLAYAQANLGQVVGNGECWTLGHRAFKDAGAQGAVKYVFGTEIARGSQGTQNAFAKTRVGDVIQFDATKFNTGSGWFQAGAPNHTAVIESITGNKVTVLEQNVPTGGAVKRTTYDFSTVTNGIYVIYRAYPKA